MHHSEINTFHSVCKSKISFAELYEYIRHIHACQFIFVYLYESIRHIHECQFNFVLLYLLIVFAQKPQHIYRVDVSSRTGGLSL